MPEDLRESDQTRHAERRSVGLPTVFQDRLVWRPLLTPGWVDHCPGGMHNDGETSVARFMSVRHGPFPFPTTKTLLSFSNKRGFQTLIGRVKK